MKRTIVTLLLATYGVAGMALDLKGVRLGMTQEELQSVFPQGESRPAPGLSRCFGAGPSCTVNVGTLGGVPTRLQVSFLEGKVAHVYSGDLSPANFGQVAEALKAKFGEPTASSVGQVQNRLGGKFDNPSYVWRFPEGELRAAKFMPGAPTMDIAQVEIDSPEWMAKKDAENAKRKADL